MSRMTAAIPVAFMLALNAAPAPSIEAATADDTARILAGLPASSSSPLGALTEDPAWQHHAHFFNSIFARVDMAVLSKVRAFSREHLADSHDTMLYMFSGPDFLYATSFFPNASTYVLAGLEPVGDIPELTSLGPLAIDAELQKLRLSMNSLLSFSFFITQKMKSELHEGPVYGTLPILYVFLARTGKTIHDVSLVSLDGNGNVLSGYEPAATNVDTVRAGRTAVHGAAPGVKIVFSDGNGPKRTLYYFRTNLADGYFERSGFAAFCAKLGPADSFIKSASYLLHKGGFNGVRKFLLDNSATILQDDSGIPLGYFNPQKWRLEPFGRYVGPISIFASFYQPGLAELFRRATPIDFGVGYRWRKDESNLLLAQKSTPINSEVELTPQSPTDGDTQEPATRSPKKARKRVETESAGSFGCRIAGFFPFCWPPKPNH